MTVEFLWGERSRPTRGPKPALTLERITDAAIAIADAEGLAAVSMQRVAADLGFTKMSLYRYLPGKTELVALMVERALGEPPRLPEPGAAPAAAGGGGAEPAAGAGGAALAVGGQGAEPAVAGGRGGGPAAGEGGGAGPETGGPGWRVALTAWAEALLGRYAGHGWALEATAGARPVGPHELGWMECALAAMPAGLSGAERMDAVATVAGHVRMIAGQVGGEGELTAAIGLVLRERADRFPAVAAAVADAAEHGGGDQAFQFGLERILDGLGVVIAKRA